METSKDREKQINQLDSHWLSELKLIQCLFILKFYLF